MVQKEEVINMVKFVQNIEEVKNLYNRQEVESRKYRGRIPKKKRIRNKIQKKRKLRESPFILDEFHLI
mgnify:CR=1 FL=1